MKEDTGEYENDFQEDRKDLISAFASFGHPFMEQDPRLVQIVTRVFSESAAESVSQSYVCVLVSSASFLILRWALYTWL